MRVRAGAHRQVVLAREAERLVVVGLEEQPGVVDLEDVDVGQMAMEGRGVRDRVQAVEGVGDVDEAALLLDRRDRVREGHAARDLLGEEEPDHLALAVGLHLLARDHGQAAVARELDRLERAAEHVVVGDGDRAEPDRLGLVEHVLDLDRAIARPRGVQVEVGEDPLAVGERLIRRRCSSLAPPREARVELFEVGRDVGEGLALDASPRLLGELAAQRLVLGQPRERRGGELGLLVHARRRGDRGAGGGRLERDAREAVERGDEDRGLVRGSRRGFARRGRCARAPGRGASPGSSAARRAISSAGRRAPSRAAGAARGRRLSRAAARRAATRGRRAFASPGRPEELGVDALLDDPVLAGEALRGRVGGLRRGRDERVDAREQPLALRLARRVAEALRREEARHRERARVPQGDVREARQPRLEAVDDVELAPRRAPRRGSPARPRAGRSGSGARSGRQARPRSAARWRRRAERGARRRGRRRGSRGRARSPNARAPAGPRRRRRRAR